MSDDLRYEVLAELGRGGMGEVMTARDAHVGREVALKRMRVPQPSERAIGRFLREASIQGRLEHPAIVPVHDIGRDAAGKPFFTMKKLVGTTLSHVLHDPGGPTLSRRRMLGAFTEVCLAIEFAHTRGVVHRDLKPDNIMLGEFGEVYVLDWGVAKIVGARDGEAGVLDDLPAFDDLGSGASGDYATKAGTVIGTAGYIAPEQVKGRADVDHRADVFSLGCVLFEILAGEPLFDQGPAGMYAATRGVDARPSQRVPDREIPPELDAVCVAATAVDPSARIASARELGDRVQAYLDGDRDHALRRDLAAQHLERARAAFGDRAVPAQRTLAMREAARALALDPALAGAGELVGRLMLEPPDELPPEVEAAVAADDMSVSRANSRIGMWAYLSFLVIVPALVWISPPADPYVPVLALMIALNGGVCWFGSRFGKSRRTDAVFALTQAALVALVARMYTPILIAPGIATVIAVINVVTPQWSRLTSWIGMAALMSVAIVGIWLAEQAGVWPRTTHVDEVGVHLYAVAVGPHESRVVMVALGFVVILIATGCALARAIRERDRVAKRRLHLQAWQLGQLVPR